MSEQHTYARCTEDHRRAIIEWLNETCPAIPRCIGIQGVQGCGKTYACARMVDELVFEHGKRAVCLSLDDFYLPSATLRGRTRGPPGTHDIACLASVLDELRAQRAVRVPVYDKGASRGVGDRCGWRELVPPYDVIFVEGWCLGFRPVCSGDEADVAIAEYHARLFETKRIDGLVVLRAPAYCAREWRLDAERRAPREQMTDEAFDAFMRAYEPLYAKYLPVLHHDEAPMPCPVLRLNLRAHPSATLIKLSENENCAP